jgi:hypothetical protein
MTRTPFHRALLALTPVVPLALVACGGGSSSDLGVSMAERHSAASTTASTNPACAPAEVGSFRWEIGDANGALGAGQVGAGAPAADLRMNIASASKWVYAAYVVQKVGIRASDRPYLNFTSGYGEFLPVCGLSDTVNDCLVRGGTGQDPTRVGLFAYGGGHMQRHAVAEMGLGGLDSAALAIELQAQIGQHGMAFSQPELAGSIVASSDGYASFLRRMLKGELALAQSLGTQRVCANPDAAGCNAVTSPISGTEDWGYSLGHWVEDDPVVGDGAFSSPGAFGFYPWINADRTLYGVLAREDFSSEAGFKSALCGRLIRQAWATGVAVSSPTPTQGS